MESHISKMKIYFKEFSLQFYVVWFRNFQKDRFDHEFVLSLYPKWEKKKNLTCVPNIILLFLKSSFSLRSHICWCNPKKVYFIQIQVFIKKIQRKINYYKFIFKIESFLLFFWDVINDNLMVKSSDLEKF